MVKLTTGKVVNELSELSTEERILVFNEFRSYVRECMEIYAKNFNRDRELTANDLVYFGRIEEFRHFTGFDEEVKLGLKNREILNLVLIFMHISLFPEWMLRKLYLYLLVLKVEVILIC